MLGTKIAIRLDVENVPKLNEGRCALEHGPYRYKPIPNAVKNRKPNLERAAAVVATWSARLKRVITAHGQRAANITAVA